MFSISRRDLQSLESTDKVVACVSLIGVVVSSCSFNLKRKFLQASSGVNGWFSLMVEVVVEETLLFFAVFVLLLALLLLKEIETNLESR